MVESLPDLAKFFRRVQAVDLSRGLTPAILKMTNTGWVCSFGKVKGRSVKTPSQKSDSRPETAVR